MPSVVLPRWFLCVDGGGTAVKVVVASSDGQISSATGGPCNVKSVGAQVALATIVATTHKTLAQIPDSSLSLDEADPLVLPSKFFSSVWLALAGILHKTDVDAFAPLARQAFGFSPEDPALRITNDGQLLGAPCLAMPQVDYAIALVAGTGSVGLAFAKDGPSKADLRLCGVDGGWGYLLGDEGSGFSVARIAVRRLLAAHDAATTASLRDPSAAPSALLPLFSDLLETFNVSDAADLVDRTYADHSRPTESVPPSFTSSESNRKLWMAAGAPVVLAYAFGGTSTCLSSIAVARSIVEEAVSPLVDAVQRLVGEYVDPKRALLSLGGGMWRTDGYRDLLVRGLRERGLEFARVKVVDSAAMEGARALRAQVAP